MSTHHGTVVKSLLGALGLAGCGVVQAQQAAPSRSDSPAPSTTVTPPADNMIDMPMEPKGPNNEAMKSDSLQTPEVSTHATEPSLERPAASRHVTLPPMSGMDMDDASNQHRVFIENIEGINGNRNGLAWDAQAWFGGDFNKLWLKSEGSRLGGRTQDAKVEALWAHAILPFWDTQLGLRHDFSGGPAREWAAFGVQGISPYWFDIEATAYVGDAGRTAARLKVEYDLYLTQRWVIKPEAELNAYGKADPERHIGSGLSDGQFELRLRYEFTRRVAPYLGFVVDKKFGNTATSARRDGEPAVDHRIVGGVLFFF